MSVMRKGSHYAHGFTIKMRKLEVLVVTKVPFFKTLKNRQSLITRSQALVISFQTL